MRCDKLGNKSSIYMRGTRRRKRFGERVDRLMTNNEAIISLGNLCF